MCSRQSIHLEVVEETIHYVGPECGARIQRGFPSSTAYIDKDHKGCCIVSMVVVRRWSLRCHNNIPRIPRPFESTDGCLYSRTNLIIENVEEGVHRGRRGRVAGRVDLVAHDMIAGWPPVRVHGERMLSDKS